MGRIADAWQRIASWYDKHGGIGILCGGASETEIEELERIVNVLLPEEFKDSYRLHNGTRMSQGIFLDGSHLLSLEGIKNAWTAWCDVRGEEEEEEDSDNGAVKDMSWNNKWIPFTDSFAADHFCIDLDPGRVGKGGQIIDFSHEEGPVRVVAENLTEWLTDFADLLESGRYELRGDELVRVRQQDDH